MQTKTNDTKLIGIFMLSIIAIGIVSISPEVESPDFLTAAAQNATKVTLSGVNQFVIALLYLAIAVLLFPTISTHGAKCAIGYLCLTAIAVALIAVGSLIISAVLLFSQALMHNPVQDPEMANAVGHMLKISRDFTNHGYMVLALCAGKILLYAVFFTSRFAPRVLSVLGIAAAIISMAASVLVLFQVIDVVTTEYVALNTPTALHEVVLAFWFIFKARPLL
ncbi:hypothetical protein BWR17_19470 (plasmid) [Phaeobacter inhibens]|uniref:DUF4386 domain-containing protein n=1 Tax=Phaeobacter inhibens TaxID=221822 RepID=UPI0009718EB2|nr:DUF4386 domain-containing protein [Phaeobacter inhibens]APX18066.1 hypothetical protein BWR17_19470 [Phaeobacter inhibens]